MPFIGQLRSLLLRGDTQNSLFVDTGCKFLKDKTFLRISQSCRGPNIEENINLGFGFINMLPSRAGTPTSAKGYFT